MRLSWWPRRWQPHELGHSLPIAGPLRRAALALALLALATCVLLALAAWAVGRSTGEAIADERVETVALDRLRRVELPVWDPGPELEEAEAPDFAPPPPPPPLRDPHPGDPRVSEPSRFAQAVSQLDGDDPIGPATTLKRLSDDEPGSWLLAYDAAVAVQRADLARQAGPLFDRALRRVVAYQGTYTRRPEQHAAMIATRYAVARNEAATNDCLNAIGHLKLAVAELGGYVRTSERVFDRRLPYSLDPLPLTNLDVWSALAEAYLGCEGTYPREYLKERPDRTFRNSEYRDPADPAVTGGPFPTELAECIETDGAASRCWALSNLNSVYVANRSLWDDGSLSKAFEGERDALARLVYNVALLASEGPDRDGAAEILLTANRLHRAGSGDDSLGPRIARLARHLGARDKDYTVLAAPYAGKGLRALGLTVETPPEDLKGMAWALRDGWHRHLRQGEPGKVFADVAAVRQQVPGEYVESLDRWEADATDALEAALADEIREQRQRRNLGVAAGLRDFRAPYLSEDWPGKADAAWTTWPMRLAVWGAVLVGLLVALALFALLRYGVYPYLMHTRDYYRRELERRRRERDALNLPVTGAKIYEYRRSRGGQGRG